jgi:hypothetical protein
MSLVGVCRACPLLTPHSLHDFRYDCGLFVCKYIECICRGVPLNEAFREEQMPDIRKHVCLSLLYGEVM